MLIPLAALAAASAHSGITCLNCSGVESDGHRYEAPKRINEFAGTVSYED